MHPFLCATEPNTNQHHANPPITQQTSQFQNIAGGGVFLDGYCEGLEKAICPRQIQTADFE